MNLLPKRPLTDRDLERNAKDIPHFRGVFMRNDLPNKIWNNESAIVNLDLKQGLGTHWVAYKKEGNKIIYFDSFGDLRPPKELLRYFGKTSRIQYNYKRYQKIGSSNCGHLCLKFLYDTI